MGQDEILKILSKPPCVGQGGQHRNQRSGEASRAPSQRLSVSPCPPRAAGCYLLQLGSGGGDRYVGP